MRVFMLGWEFPPFITGGLGTACHGLTRALDRRGVEVIFAIPKAVDRSFSSHVTLVSPEAGTDGPPRVQIAPPAAHPAEPRSFEATPTAANPSGGPQDDGPVAADPRGDDADRTIYEHVELVEIPAGFVNPYADTAGAGPVGETDRTDARRSVGDDRSGDTGAPGAGRAGRPPFASDPAGRDMHPEVAAAAEAMSDGSIGVDYGGDLIHQVGRYAMFCLAAARRMTFDVVHAHDWMTYPAGMMIARATGRPLVVHVHSTEFDRSGENVNQAIYDIERRGMHAAMKVITVSQLTKNMVVRRYDVPSKRVEVVYNGVEMEPHQFGATGIAGQDKIVLYFGRITFQKGPEYFIRAAKRVLEMMPNVKFVVAGDGDMATRMMEMAAELGIGHRVLFTGFLRGEMIARVFSIADLYVMPSVSEPFGIAPLEAMTNDVPVLISKSSGVSEILTHALKVDFWDTDDMADKIIAVLRHPPLSRTLRQHGAFEVRGLTWEGAAQRCEQIYNVVRSGMRTPARV